MEHWNSIWKTINLKTSPLLKTNRQNRIIFGLVTCVFIVMAGYLGYITNQPPEEVEEKPNTVAVSYGDVRQSVNAPGKLVNSKLTDLTMQVEGHIKDIFVKPGQKVKKGELLASLDEAEKYKSLAETSRSASTQAERDLEDLINNAPKASADAQLEYLKAQTTLNDAQKKYERMKYPRASQADIDLALANYYESLNSFSQAQETYEHAAGRSDTDPEHIAALQSLAAARAQRDHNLAVYNYSRSTYSQADKDQAEAELAQAKADLEISRQRWERVKDGPDDVELQKAQSKAQEAKVAAENAEQAYQNTNLVAPFDGLVINLNVKKGQTVTPTTVVLSFTDPASFEALVTIVEEDFSLIHIGQSASIFLDSQPDETISARVDRIIPQRSSSDRATYPVYLSLDTLLENLAGGMTVDASILIEGRTHVLTLPRSLVRSSGGGKAVVEVWKDGVRQKRDIQVGLIGDQNVEIISGLAEGEEVVSR